MAAGYDASRVNAGKYAAPVADMPQSILILPHALLQDQNVHSVRDMPSNHVAGITFAAGEGGGGLGDNLSMRGFQSRNNIHVDGIRDATQMVRSDDFNLDHSEVIRGSDSSCSGAGAVAGVINLSRKRPALTNCNHISPAGETAANRRATLDINRPQPQRSQSIAIRFSHGLINAFSTGFAASGMSAIAEQIRMNFRKGLQNG